MPHLHLSVQAGDTLILKRMKRRHARGDVVDLCARLRALRPEIAFGADLIAGFPTETEAMFANTLALVEEAGLTYLHVFPYSARKGTPAARMPQVAGEQRRERGEPPAGGGRAGAGGLSRRPGRPGGAGAGRTWRHRSHRGIRAVSHRRHSTAGRQRDRRALRSRRRRHALRAGAELPL